MRSSFQKVSFHAAPGCELDRQHRVRGGRMFQDTTFSGSFIHTAPQ